MQVKPRANTAHVSAGLARMDKTIIISLWTSKEPQLFPNAIIIFGYILFQEILTQRQLLLAEETESIRNYTRMPHPTHFHCLFHIPKCWASRQQIVKVL